MANFQSNSTIYMLTSVMFVPKNVRHTDMITANNVLNHVEHVLMKVDE